MSANSIKTSHCVRNLLICNDRTQRMEVSSAGACVGSSAVLQWQLVYPEESDSWMESPEDCLSRIAPSEAELQMSYL